MISKTQYGEFLTLKGVAETTGYSIGYVTNMFTLGRQAHDPVLRSIAVQTDETFRKLYDTKVQYVFRRSDVKRWYANRTGR